MRRMFSTKITEKATFLRMPLTTQALYFHLGTNADDDGVVEAFKVLRMTGANEDDLRVLVARDFIKILNEDMVAFICDWSEHNLIRADRKRNSIYQHLLIKMLPEVEIIKPRVRAEKLNKAKTLDDGYSQSEVRRDNFALPYSFSYKIKQEFINEPCPVCQEFMVDEGECKVSIQHNQPIAQGGLHELDNISIICFKCNMHLKNQVTDKLNNALVKERWAKINGDWTAQRQPKDGIREVKLREVKLREVKLREEKGMESVAQNLEELQKQFPKKQVRQEFEKAKDWLASTGKRKKDYNAFFRNWLRRANDERIPPKEEFKLDPSLIDHEKLARLNKIKQGVKGI